MVEYRIKGPYAEERGKRGGTVVRVDLNLLRSDPGIVKRAALIRLQPLYDELTEPIALTESDLEIKRMGPKR